jgi:predicted transcriptional regulator
MGTTKTYLFSDEQYKIAIAISSFTHTARRTIIHHLLKVIACINSNLVQELSLVQATISQYASELKNIGIIQETIEET